jgi:HlyD family secretion protein
MSMPRKRFAAPAIVVLAAALVLIMASADSDPPNTLFASGTVEGTEALVGFRHAGQIAEMHVREGDLVVAGQVLAVLDTAALQARRLQAMAQAQSASALLREMRGGSRPQELAQASSAVETARVKLADAHRDLERTRKLFEGGVVSRETHDKAVMAVDVLEQQYRQARAQSSLVTEGPRREQIEAQAAQLAQAEAMIAEIDALIADAVVRAPFAGVVTVRHRDPGEVVAPGAAAVSLLDRSERWVRIYIPENRLAAVHLGSRAVITTDSFRDRTYGGEVSVIASEAEFTPRSVQTAEERVKLVYSARVRINDDAGYDLKPGMPADVSVALAPGSGSDD